MKSAEEIFEKFVKRFKENPEKPWTYIIDPIWNKGELKLYVSNGDDFWYIHTKIITPYKVVGMVGKLDERPEFTAPYYGIRFLDKKNIIKLLKAVKDGDKEKFGRIIEKIKRINPDDLYKIYDKEGIVTEGPIEIAKVPIISEKQRKLDEKMNKEVRKLIEKYYGSMYR
ncbi:MAG: hypothetical protein J7J92_01120 [Candidatus Aenigmarchaeota archaeon]|nr:hypothetical protein [Candidatus Aenigmarchaeota archaeon]